MKKLFVLSMAVLALNAQAKLGSNQQVKYAGDLSYSNFCEAVVEDDLRMLKRSVEGKLGVVAYSKREVLKQLMASEGMTCNGVNLVTFAQQRNASAVYKYLSNFQ